MRNYPSSFLQEAAGLALCWRLFRRDGRVMGFTQHDADLVFGGIVHEAATGFDLGKAERGLSGQAGLTRLMGALSSLKITEADIAAGFYDQAKVETWLCNWQDTTQTMLVDSGIIGQIERGDQGFIVEIRSLADQWQQPRGRLYQALCAADLGDAQCKVSLADNRYSYQSSVLAPDGMHGFTAADGGYGAGLFTAGLVRFLTGGNAGISVDVRAHSCANSQALFSLWRPLPALVRAGDRFIATAGCDKRLETCRTRFANHVNYVLVRRVSDGTPGLDGGSLFQ